MGLDGLGKKKTKSQEWKLPFKLKAVWDWVVFRFRFPLVGRWTEKYLHLGFLRRRWWWCAKWVNVRTKGRKMRSRVHCFFSVWRAVEQVFRETDSSKFTPRPGRRRPPAVWRASRGPHAAPYRCERRSLVCASSSHSTACAGSAAPSSPLRTQHQGRPAKQTQLNLWPHCLSMISIALRKISSVFPPTVILLPVCLQRWAAGRLAALSLSAVWPAHCEPPSDGLCGSCPPQTPPLHEKQSKKWHY